MKKLFWKMRYSYYLKRKYGFKIKDAWHFVTGILHDCEDDLEFCPKLCADEAMSYWVD